MGLDELVRCIELLKERMQSHRGVLSESETRTRTALIDPLLRTLGWDVSAPEVVIPEYKLRGYSADYALMGLDGQPTAIVEAKRLDAKLGDKEQEQMVTYANVAGISYACLTDGNHWELYDVCQRAALPDKRILQASIANAPTHETALKLLLLWRPNLASENPVEAETSILNREQPTQSPSISPASPEAPEPETSQGHGHKTPKPLGPSGDWIDLFEYDPPAHTPCPSAILFWDGSKKSLKAWYEIIICLVEKLYTEQWLTPNDLPIKTSTSYRVHTEPVGPNGKRFVQHRRIEGKPPLFVNITMNAHQVRTNATRLLRRFGRKSATVYLQVSEQ